MHSLYIGNEATLLLSIFSRKVNSAPQKLMSINVYGNFILARNLKQLKYWSTGKWIKKLWYTHKMAFYPSVKSN